MEERIIVKIRNSAKNGLISMVFMGALICPTWAQEVSMEKLLEQLRGENSAGRNLAAAQLGKMKDPRVVSSLIQMLKEDCFRWKGSVIPLLLAVGEPAAEPLLALLNSPDENTCVLTQTAAVLGEFKEARAVEPLAQLLLRMLDVIGENTFRNTAAKALGQLKDFRATDSLLAALLSEDGELQKAAAEALSQIQDPRSLGPLITAFLNKEGQSRPAIAEALGHLKDKKATDVLVGALTDEDWHVREKAAQALDNIGWSPQAIGEQVSFAIAKQDWPKCIALGAPAVEPLLVIVQRREHGVAMEAAAALGALKEPRAAEPIAELLMDKEFYTRSVKREIAQSLAKLGSPAIDPLVKALNDEDDDVRQAAAQALSLIKDPRVIDVLFGALKDADSSVRETAAATLDQIGVTPRSEQEKALYFAAKKEWQKCIGLGKSAVDALVARLREPHSNISIEAADALGVIKDPAAVEPLINVLQDKSGSGLDRAHVAAALGELRDTRSVEPLLAVLREEYSEAWGVDLRVQAVTALGKIHDSRAVEPLVALLQDKNSSVRMKAAQALDMLGWAPASDVDKFLYFFAKQDWARCAGLGKTAVEPLLKMLLESDSPKGVARALGALKDPKAVEPLIAVLKKKVGMDSYENPITAALSAIGQPAVSPLLEVLKDQDHQIRRAAVMVLGDIADPRAVMPLVDSLNDFNSNVRSAAAVALDKLKWVPQTQREKVLYAIAKEDWEQCRKLGKSAGDILGAMLQDKRFDRTEAIIIALGGMGDKEVIPVLIPHLQNWSLGPATAYSLKRLGWNPTSEKEKVHFFVASRNKENLLAMWDKSREILFEEVESPDYPIIENALFAFVGIGKQEIIADLITAISKKGTKVMAEAFLNCGNPDLRAAAESWAASHGYYITSGNGTQSVRWGSW